MSDSDEDCPSPSPRMSEYPTYEIDCNLETLMAIKPPLSVLLHPPEYTNTQFIIEGNESPIRSMETESPAPGMEIPFQIYSRPLDNDGTEEFTDHGGRGIVTARREETGAFVDYGDYSEDNISDNSLDDLLDPPPNFREGFRDRLPDILDNLAGVQGGSSTCRCVGDYLTVTADRILIRSPDEKQNRSTSDYQIIQTKEENEEEQESDERLQREENDFNKADDSTDSQEEGSQDELLFGEYGFSDLDFQSKDLLTKELKMKFPMQSNTPQGTGHLELTKEERRMMIDEMLLLRRDTIKGNRRHSWTSNIKLDLDLEDCKSLIVRKSSTGPDLPPKVNLYSENIVIEEETTETVDRGSIADLAKIKKHWEDRFELVESEKEPVRKTQKVVRHWSVKLPNIPGKPNNRKDEPTPEVVNRNLENMTAINDDYNENESAIEREIRWAMEREEMLRQEQEQRQLLREKMALQQEEEKHNGVQTQQIIEHYENTDKEKFKPTYHEMTEADLGHEIAKKEAIKEQEMRNQKEQALQNGESVASDNSDKLGPTPIHFRETVVQAEIRLQRERDAQFKEQQKLLNSSIKVVENEPVTETTNVNDPIVDNNDNPPPQPSVPEPSPPLVRKPIAYKHGAESKIAQELEEAKVREEEFRQRLKEREGPKSESPALNGNNSKDSVDDMESSVKSLDLEESMMSISSENDGAISTAAGKTNTFINETPIDREIRLAREREEEYRRLKGYPRADKLTSQRSLEAKADVVCIPKLNLKNKPVKDDTMKKIAASRLKLEIKQERNREVTLRESGRINTTSDETVGEQMKYKEIEVAEGPVKRNFIMRKNSVPKAESTESQPMDTDSSTKGMSDSQKKNAPNYVIKTPKICATFSFQEARSNAGSMIEQELKEMREREAELKKQREHLQNKANNNETNE